jgi:hypothetical protein
MSKNKYSIKRYDGDDKYSWGVFHAADVKGMPNQLFYGDARPIRCGMSRSMAIYEKKQLEKRDAEKLSV